MSGFYQHIKEAVRINKERQPIYDALAGRTARRASNLLIWTEYICLPFALRFDRRGKRFNEAGIPIIQDDFVSMENVGNPHDPPTFTNRAGQSEFEALRIDLIEYKRCLVDSANNLNFEQVVRDTARILAAVVERETRCEAHFAMVRHVLESIGLTAVNATRFGALSAGKTVSLSRDLLVFEVKGARMALALDWRAQEVHSLGAGFLVNDLPSIPFPAPQPEETN